jgi:hypothetical protein
LTLEQLVAELVLGVPKHPADSRCRNGKETRRAHHRAGLHHSSKNLDLPDIQRRAPSS